MHDLFSWAWVKCCFTSFKKTCLFNLQTLGWSPSQAFKKGSRVTIPKRSQFAERSRSLSDLMSWFNDFNESRTMQFVCPARFLSQNVSTSKYFQPNVWERIEFSASKLDRSSSKYFFLQTKPFKHPQNWMLLVLSIWYCWILLSLCDSPKKCCWKTKHIYPRFLLQALFWVDRMIFFDFTRSKSRRISS